jgi:hypothetical protein
MTQRQCLKHSTPNKITYSTTESLTLPEKFRRNGKILDKDDSGSSMKQQAQHGENGHVEMVL